VGKNDGIGDIARDSVSRIVRDAPGERFHAGWRFLPESDRLTLPPGFAHPRTPDISVDVVRGRDLVGLSVDFFGAKVVTEGAEMPHVERKGAGPWLMTVTFPYQHAHEEAQYVTDAGSQGDAIYPDPDDPTKTQGTPPSAPPVEVSENAAPSMPVGYQPARASRLVFAIGPADRVEFTRAGILRAMTTLTPVLHPNAEPPGTSGSIDDSTDGFRLVWIDVNLVARYSGAQILVDRPTAADRRRQPPPDPATASGAVQFAQNVRTVRMDAGHLTIAAGAGLGARAQLPPAFRRLTLARTLREIVSDASDAGVAGGFDHPDAQIRRMSVELDQEGWSDVVRVLDQALTELQQIQADSAVRTGERQPDRPIIDAEIALLRFRRTP